MINSLKTIAVFGCAFTSRYRQNLCKAFNTAAKKLGVNLVYFNFLGKIGNKDAQYGECEFDFIEAVDLDGFDGIIFDGEGYNVEGMGDKMIAKLRKAKCPVVSVSSIVDGFYNIEFEDAAGIRMLTEHFIDVHHFDRIGFMSGYLTHPDAQIRLKEFRKVMKSRGLPEDGVGMFEGDFWFHKGEEAADYFLSRPERPQAVVCANDYMAISLATAFKNRGIRVPDDIAVSGFDGTLEGQEFLPHITSGTRERYDIALKAISLIIDLCRGVEIDKNDLKITPKLIFAHSCGCAKLDYKKESENINNVYDVSRRLSFNLYDAESAFLKMNKVDSIERMGLVFKQSAMNFGEFRSFFLNLNTDIDGRTAYNSDYLSPSGKYKPVIWIDRNGEYTHREELFTDRELLPETENNEPHFFYLMSVHCAERQFGYSVIEMEDMDIFNEFYNVWLINIAMTLETLMKNDRIKKLIGTLEELSIRDDLTGMLNRRGFDELSRDAITALESSQPVCTMVIDMDGLKRINDEFGHHEGDLAIKAAANTISKCCTSGEIAGRAGGDEFYIFALDYSEEKVKSFTGRLESYLAEYNAQGKRPYKVELSYGAYVTEIDRSGRLEDLLSESDSRMYVQKQAKPNRRRS